MDLPISKPCFVAVEPLGLSDIAVPLTPASPQGEGDPFAIARMVDGAAYLPTGRKMLPLLGERAGVRGPTLRNTSRDKKVEDGVTSSLLFRLLLSFLWLRGWRFPFLRRPLRRR